MRRGAAPGMNNCPENRSIHEVTRRYTKAKPSCPFVALRGSVFIRRGGVNDMNNCPENSLRCHAERVGPVWYVTA
jgi:hypothetical protein